MFNSVLLLGELLSILAIATNTQRLYLDARAVTHFFCHQLPSRCPWFGGMPTVLCFRCIGLYSGIIAGPALLKSRVRNWPNPVLLLSLLAFAPSAIELLVDRLFDPGISAFLRWASGMSLGLGCIALISLLAEKQTQTQAIGGVAA